MLIGTTSVEKSEYLSRRFTDRGIPHTVLNAKHLELEAGIVAEAGRRCAVTVATDMAGRGTDIVLGGNIDFLTDKRLRAGDLDPMKTPDAYERAWREVRSTVKAEAAAEGEEVLAVGGLYVVGTERHESRRIDNQLRGRCGRQGDPGETRFYLSLGDDLMRRFSDINLPKLMARLKMPDDEPIHADVITRAIKSAQTQVEQQNFEMRKNVLKYDEVLNRQRTVIYSARRRVLAGEDLKQQVHDMLVDVITAYIGEATATGHAKDWDVAALWTALRELYPVAIDSRSVVCSGPNADRTTRRALLAAVLRDAENALSRREVEIDTHAGEGAMRQLERDIILEVIDRKWRDHLYEMDYLKAGIGLRALAQRDPLVEYQLEGYDMFVRMLEGVKEECVRSLFHAVVKTAPPLAAAPATEPVRLAQFAAVQESRQRTGLSR